MKIQYQPEQKEITGEINTQFDVECHHNENELTNQQPRCYLTCLTPRVFAEKRKAVCKSSEDVPEHIFYFPTIMQQMS